MTWNLDKSVDVIFWGGVSYVAASVLSLIGLFDFWGILATVWSASAGISLYRSSIKLPVERKAIFITGCDTGIGQELALHLHDKGFRIFAACLQADSGGDGAQRLKLVGSSRLQVLQLDVTKKEQIRNALFQVKQLLPEGETLWGLINNAGISGFGEVEWVPMDTFRSICQVNVFGLIEVTKAFLPLVRKAQGRVVNMGSVCGRIGRGGMSPYVHSKFAVEGFSDCLRCEMRHWGVKVCIIEPSNYSAGTQITSASYLEKQALSMWQTMDDGVKKDYSQEYFDHAVNIVQAHSRSGLKDITPILDSVTEALTQKYPRARYIPVTNFYFFKLFVVSHLPEWIYELLFTTSWRQKR